jgi:hexosaminidase
MMKKLIFLVVVFFTGRLCAAQTNYGPDKIHIIPEPVSVTTQQGHFLLRPATRILVENPSVTGVAGLFAKMLNTPTGYHLLAKKSKSSRVKNDILLRINQVPDSILGNEGYRLQVSARKVVVTANTPRGIFYGMQSLMQLLPPQIESDSVVKHVAWDIPCVSILDYPRFKWRGLMLDVSRHFFSKKFVEEYIDEMAKYKFNVFHWHLTDDQGWRIQIKGLPRLTEVGAWRVPRTGRWGTFPAPQPGEKATEGGITAWKTFRKLSAMPAGAL